MSGLVVFEDPGHEAFGIVAALRPVFDLRCGARTLLERLCEDSGRTAPVRLLVRAGVAAVAREAHTDATLDVVAATAAQPVRFANGRLLALGGDLQRFFDGPESGVAVLAGGDLVAARLQQADAVRLFAALEEQLAGGRREAAAWIRAELPHVRCTALEEAARDGSHLLAHTWDLVSDNGRAIIDDFRKGPGAGVEDGALVYPGVHLLQDGNIRIARGVRVKPGVVLDAEDGPITLDADAAVQPGVVVRGPAYVGRGTLLRAGAKVHEGTSLGPVCKIGGEVEESVVQAYSNKQHEGFLGHAYLGEWVNLGADTNNSDLKNNYSPVRVWESGRFVDSQQLFVGLLAGDHVKSAINTQFNTGTVVGTASQVFGSGFPPKFVPPFSWGGADALEVYDFERALDTARAVMRRRQVELTPAYAELLRSLFEAWRDAPRQTRD